MCAIIYVFSGQHGFEFFQCCVDENVDTTNELNVVVYAYGVIRPMFLATGIKDTLFLKPREGVLGEVEVTFPIHTFNYANYMKL